MSMETRRYHSKQRHNSTPKTACRLKKTSTGITVRVLTCKQEQKRKNTTSKKATPRQSLISLVSLVTTLTWGLMEGYGMAWIGLTTTTPGLYRQKKANQPPTWHATNSM